MTDDRTMTTPGPGSALLATPPRVVNIGLPRFADDLKAAGATVVHVAWAPPAGGDLQFARLLAKLGS